MKKGFLAMMVAMAGWTASCQMVELDSDDGMDKYSTVKLKLNLDKVRPDVQAADADYLLYYKFNLDEGARLSPDARYEGVLSICLTDEYLHIDKVDARVDEACFWMQRSDEAAYDYKDVQNVKVDYTDMGRNDAWSAKISGLSRSSGSSHPIEVSLESSFATVLVMTTKDDMQAARNAGLDIEDCVTTFMLRQPDGSVVEIPNMGTIGEVWTATDGQQYILLYKNHIWVQENGLVNGEITISKDGNTFNRIDCNNLPVKKGGHTVYANRFLTSDVNFNISISPTFEGDYDVW